MPGTIVEDPALRQRYRFERASDPGGGEVLRVEMWVDPGGGVTPHVHPAMEERFSVLSGRAQLLGGHRWADAVPGDEPVVVPPGTRHAFRNRGEETAHMVAEARPPSTLQAFLEDVAGLSRAGAITGGGLPRSPTALLQAMVLADHYRDMVVLGFPLPPAPVQRLLVPALARLGERRGHRAGAFKHLAARSDRTQAA